MSLRLFALVPGLALLEGYVLARRYQRKRGWLRDPLPEGFVPTVSACLFAVLAAGLTWAGISTTSSGLDGGPGAYLSGAIVALAVAPVSFPRCGAPCCATPTADPLPRARSRRRTPPSPAVPSPPGTALPPLAVPPWTSFSGSIVC